MKYGCIVLERLSEAALFLILLTIGGPFVHHYISSDHLFRISTYDMSFKTAISALMSPIYILLSISVIFLYKFLNKKMLKIIACVPAAVLCIFSNTLSNWIDPLILLTTIGLVCTSVVMALLWRFPRTDLAPKAR
jgi:hypothetical protein